MSSSPTGWSSLRLSIPQGGRGVLASALIASCLLLPFLGSRHLLNPDEPRDAEVAREFADGGWSVVPRLNGEPYFSKPPLFFGSVGLLMKATGSQEEWVARAGAALHGVLAVAATAALGEILLGPGFGFLAGLLLLGTPYALLRFRTCTTDVGLTAWITVAILLLVLAERRGSMLLSLAGGASAGLAVWAKAHHGLLFPFLVVGIATALDRERRPGAAKRIGIGIFTGAVVAGMWVLVLRLSESSGGGADPARTFLLGNVEKRFGAEAHHQGGFFDYWHLLYRGLPWTLVAAAAVWVFYRGGKEERGRLRLPLVWVAGMVLALSLSPAKRDSYLLPVLPGLALLAAGTVPARFMRWTAGAALLAGAATLAGEVLWVAPRSDAEWGGPVAAEFDRAAAGRPVVFFRMGEGDIGQFCFPLRRTIPVAWDEEDLRRVSDGKPVVIVVEKGVPEASTREDPDKGRRRRLSPDLLARWTLLGEHTASETWRWYGWDGR